MALLAVMWWTCCGAYMEVVLVDGVGCLMHGELDEAGVVYCRDCCLLQVFLCVVGDIR